MTACSETSRAGETMLNTRFTDTLWWNALWFQSTWFCAVLGGNTLLPLTLGLLALHLALVRNTYRELLQLSTIAFVGISIDACLSSAGLFQFPGDVLVPLWLCCVWVAFATTLSRSLAYLGQRPVLAGLAGAVAFPLNYWAGQKIGAVQFGYPLPVIMGSMALVWLLLLPRLFRLTALIGQAARDQASA